MNINIYWKQVEMTSYLKQKFEIHFTDTNFFNINVSYYKSGISVKTPVNEKEQDLYC